MYVQFDSAYAFLAHPVLKLLIRVGESVDHDHDSHEVDGDPDAAGDEHDDGVDVVPVAVHQADHGHGQQAARQHPDDLTTKYIIQNQILNFKKNK